MQGNSHPSKDIGNENYESKWLILCKCTFFRNSGGLIYHLLFLYQFFLVSKMFLDVTNSIIKNKNFKFSNWNIY